MGFDLSIVGEVKEWPAGFEPEYEEYPGERGEGWAGMRAYTLVLDHVGLIDWEVRAVFPDPPADLSQERVWELQGLLEDGEVDIKKLGDHPDAADLRRVAEWRRRMDAEALAVRSPNAGQVPAFKFSDNSGWHVVPEECQLIADALEQAFAAGDDTALLEPWTALDYKLEDAREIVWQWALYNRAAGSAGGYRVS